MANLKDLIVNGSARVIGKLFAQTPNEPTNNNEVATTAFVKNNTVTKTLDGTSKKTWIGTSAKYETDKASGLITDTTECIITDDEQELTLGVDTYTKDEIDDKIKSSYYVGQTIFSLDPLNYASLRLLDGSLLQVGGVYDEFISKYIEPLFKKHPNRFISESEWQQQVSTYGVCGKYVYTEGVAVRLPKVTGIVEGTIDPSALGDLVEAGLPTHTHTRGTMNITGTWYQNLMKEYSTSKGTGALKPWASGGTINSASGSGTGGGGIQLDASQGWTGSTSNPNYTKNIKTTDTVQPQTIKGYYYIVVATGIDEEVNLKFDTLDVDYARSDLSNLTHEGERHFVGKDNITNCLLEVPQKIKYSLVDGTLTIKAGTVAIFPDGLEEDGKTPKFKYVTLSADKTVAYYSNRTSFVYSMGATGSGADINNITTTFSGATAPESTSSYIDWYDTANNLMKRSTDKGVTWTIEQRSLPLMVVQETTEGITSVNQVFNGIGYIGSTIFMDKGVKMLVANGYNPDGTIKNEEIVTPNVIVARGLTSGTRADLIPFLRKYSTNNQLQIYPIAKALFLGELDYVPTVGATFQWYFNTSEMKWYMHEAGATEWVSAPYYNISPPITVENNVITSFKPYKPFRAIGYNDKSEVASWAMPSIKRVVLTVGAKDTTYTAPANGWFEIQLNNNSNYLGINIFDTNNNLNHGFLVSKTSTTGYVTDTTPARKGDIAKISMVHGTPILTFIYATGSESEA